MLSKCPGKKDIFKELRVIFVFFPKVIISEYFFVSHIIVSEGTKFEPIFGKGARRSSFQ